MKKLILLTATVAILSSSAVQAKPSIGDTIICFGIWIDDICVGVWKDPKQGVKANGKFKLPNRGRLIREELAFPGHNPKLIRPNK